MIKIEVIKANKSTNGIDFTTPICNNAAEKIAETLKQKVSNFKCKNHLDSYGIIKVISTPNKSSLFEISKSNFCCIDFENSVQVQIK
jgi:hypothetical protein